MAVLPPDPLFTLKGDMGYVHSMAFIPYEKDYTKSLFAATETGYVYLWDLESNRVNYKQQMGKSIQAIHCIDKKILIQEKSGALKSWIINESSIYEVENEIDLYGGYCRSLIHEDNILIPIERDMIAIFDLNFNKTASLKPTETDLGNVMCMECFKIKENDYLLTGYESGYLILFDITFRKQCSKLKLNECVTSISYDEITRRGVIGNASNILHLIAIDQSLNLIVKAEISMINDGCGIVKIRPDKKILVAGGWDGRLRLFSWKTLRVLVVLNEHKKAVTDVQFSPNVVDFWGSKVMAASSGDGTITLWNLYN
nr:guanine nucleotide-binding protein subunit beta-like protein 1 [Onthophagus taurus]